MDGGCDEITTVVATVVVRKRVREDRRKKVPRPAAGGQRTDGKAANKSGKRKSKAADEGGRPSAGGPHRCGARRGQSAAA